MDVTQLSFPDETFDVIVSFEVYEHIDPGKYEDFVRHLHRVCRRGGRVLLSTPNRLVEIPHIKSIGLTHKYHVNYVSPKELKCHLSQHFTAVTLFSQRAKERPLKRLLKVFDVFNLRHHLLSYQAKQRLDLIFSGGGPFLSCRSDRV